MIWSFLCYLVLLLGLGLLAARRTRTLKGFLLADRSLGPWITALSAEATAMSGWLLIAFPAKAFTHGLSAVWVGLACVLGDALNWLSVSKRLREQTERLRALTLPEFLEQRFSKEGGYAVQLVATSGIMVFMLLYLWAQFVAAGKVMAAILDPLDYPEACVLSALIIILYTLMGGFRAVAWTDFLQGITILFALVLLPLVCLSRIGGWSGLMEQLSQAAAEMPESSSVNLDHWFGGLTGLILFSFLFEDAGVGAGYVGQPHISTRFMAIRKTAHIRKAFVISILWTTVTCAGSVLLGLTSHYWYRLGTGGAVHSRGGEIPPFDVEQIMPMMARQVLDPWLAGILVSAMMAAIMSSADSYLLSATSSMTRDVYHRIFRQTASEAELLRISRVVTVSLGVGALLLAVSTDPWSPESTVYRLVLYAWSGLSGCFTAPVLMALFYRGMTRSGCLFGIICGGTTSLLWHHFPPLGFATYELIPAVMVSALAIWWVSRLGGNSSHHLRS